jgi:hypothetical protein
MVNDAYADSSVDIYRTWPLPYANVELSAYICTLRESVLDDACVRRRHYRLIAQ